MIISHKHKFIFICNGKTGTTSIEKALQPYDESAGFNNGAPGLWANKHMPPAVARALLPAEVWDRYFKFVFVRDPYDWCLSAWRYSYLRKNSVTDQILSRPRHFRSIFAAEQRRRSMAKVGRLDACHVDQLYHRMSAFKCFPGLESCFQYYYVHDHDGNQIVDFMGRFETLREDFLEVLARIGLNCDLPHVNRTDRSVGLGYTESGRSRVRELWQIDFQGLGYATNPKEEKCS